MVAKKTVIPIGPQHPALKEPEVFNIILNGERIVGMDMRLGYNHRGIEKACEGRNYTQCLYLIERICGICSMVHATCFIEATEEVAGLDVPVRAKYIRTIVAEMERIHSHLLWLGVAGHELGFDTLLMYSWRDREVIMDALQALTGNRVNYGINCLGGVRRDFSKEQLDDLVKKTEYLEERSRFYLSIAESETTLLARLKGVGYLSRQDAIHYGALGPTLRASGVDMDLRRDDPCCAFDKVNFTVITDDNCDVYGRCLIRIKELIETCRIIRQLIDHMPEGPVTIKAPRKIPVGEAVVRYEAPRGEALHYVAGNGTDKPERTKIRAPTLGNSQAIGKMMEGDNLADAPLIIAAIDPCFGCTDRMISITDKSSNETRVIDWASLSAFSRNWYKENHGIDFTELNQRLMRYRN